MQSRLNHEYLKATNIKLMHNQMAYLVWHKIERFWNSYVITLSVSNKKVTILTLYHCVNQRKVYPLLFLSKFKARWPTGQRDREVTIIHMYTSGVTATLTSVNSCTMRRGNLEVKSSTKYTVNISMILLLGLAVV